MSTDLSRFKYIAPKFTSHYFFSFNWGRHYPSINGKESTL